VTEGCTVETIQQTRHYYYTVQPVLSQTHGCITSTPVRQTTRHKPPRAITMKAFRLFFLCSLWYCTLAFAPMRSLQRTKVSLFSSPTIDAPVKEKKIQDDKQDEKDVSYSPKSGGGWAVRLFNDNRNKREFVALVLCQIAGLSDGQAYTVMMQAHQNGVSVIGRYDQEIAELYRDKLVENGLIVDMVPVEEE